MEEQLFTLYAKVSRQAARMQVYSLRAKQDGRPEPAALFHALELSYNAQAKRLLMQLRGFISSTEENLKNILEDELPAFAEQYACMGKTAAEEKNKAVTVGCEQAMRITRMNINLAKQLQAGKTPKSFYICDFCGFTTVDKKPESCPVCTATKRRFISVEP